LNKSGGNRQSTFVTWGYARHRGATELDMITPLFWHHRDPRIGLDRKLLFPFLYLNRSPRETTTALVPLFAHRKRYGISESIWVTPLFNYESHLRGSALSLHPLIHFGRNGHSRHRIVAPLYFDIEKLRNRTTIAAPVFLRLRSEDSLHQVFLNTYYTERSYKNGTAWEFHLLPLFSYGKSPGGHF